MHSNNSSYTIWVDADSCPTPVRELIIRFAFRLQRKTIFVANREIPIPKQELFQMIVTATTEGAADDYIAEHCHENDFAITRDIPLAARLIEKKLTVINDRGFVFTVENIREKLSIRNFNFDLAQQGIQGDKSSSYGKKELSLFANCFDRELQKKEKLCR